MVDRVSFFLFDLRISWPIELAMTEPPSGLIVN